VIMMSSLFVLCAVFVILFLQVTASSYVVAADSDAPGRLKCYKSNKIFNKVS